MSPQKLRELIDRSLVHVRCAQAPLRAERTDREPGFHRREISAALLSLSDAEDRLIRAASLREGEWYLLLSEVPSLCAQAREWCDVTNLLEGRSIRTNLDAVVELLRLYGSDDLVRDAPRVATIAEPAEQRFVVENTRTSEWYRSERLISGGPVREDIFISNKEGAQATADALNAEGIGTWIVKEAPPKVTPEKRA